MLADLLICVPKVDRSAKTCEQLQQELLDELREKNAANRSRIEKFQLRCKRKAYKIGETRLFRLLAVPSASELQCLADSTPNCLRVSVRGHSQPSGQSQPSSQSQPNGHAQPKKQQCTAKFLRVLGSLEQRLLKKVEYEEDLRHTDGQYYKIVEYKLQLSESTNRICQENTNKIKAHHGNTQNRIGTQELHAPNEYKKVEEVYDRSRYRVQNQKEVRVQRCFPIIAKKQDYKFPMIISSAIGNISSRRNRMDFMNGQDKISAGRHSPVQEIQGKAVQETQGRAVLMNISKSIRDVWLQLDRRKQELVKRNVEANSQKKKDGKGVAA